MPQVFLPKELYDELLRRGHDPTVTVHAEIRAFLAKGAPPHVRPLDSAPKPKARR